MQQRESQAGDGQTSARLELREFVRGVLQRKSDADSFTDDELLRTTGRLDSLDVVELVTFVEQRFGIDFRSEWFAHEDFDSIDSLIALVMRASR